MAPLAGQCPGCGYLAAKVGPADAAAAARSFPRRFRGLLVRPDDVDPEIVHRRAADGEPSALDHTEVAATGMAAAGRALVRIDAQPGTGVDLDPPPGPGQPVAGAAGSRRLDQVLERLQESADQLVNAFERFHGDAWAHPGTLADGTAVTALDVARAGVHAGAHHLRAAERVLERVRLLPRPEGT